jgi:hypothetical protein
VSLTGTLTLDIGAVKTMPVRPRTRGSFHCFRKKFSTFARKILRFRYCPWGQMMQNAGLSATFILELKLQKKV